MNSLPLPTPFLSVQISQTTFAKLCEQFAPSLPFFFLASAGTARRNTPPPRRSVWFVLASPRNFIQANPWQPLGLTDVTDNAAPTRPWSSCSELRDGARVCPVHEIPALLPANSPALTNLPKLRLVSHFFLDARPLTQWKAAKRARLRNQQPKRGTKAVEKNVRGPQSRVGRVLLKFNMQAKQRTEVREFVAKFIMTGADAQSTVAEGVVAECVHQLAAARTDNDVCFRQSHTEPKTLKQRECAGRNHRMAWLRLYKNINRLNERHSAL